MIQSPSSKYKGEQFLKYNKMLKKYIEHRKTKTIDALLGNVSQQTPQNLQNKYANKTKEQVQSRLRTLFTKNTAYTKDSVHTQRQVNLQLQDRPLQRKLLRGLTIKSSQERLSPIAISEQPMDEVLSTSIQVKLQIQNQKSRSPRIFESPNLTPSKSRVFTNISGQFSQWGPARSIAAITAKSLFSTSVNTTVKVIHKNEVKSNVNTALNIVFKSASQRQLKSSSSKRSSKQSQISRKMSVDVLLTQNQDLSRRSIQKQSKVQDILRNLNIINTHNIKPSYLYQQVAQTAREDYSGSPSIHFSKSMKSSQQIQISNDNMDSISQSPMNNTTTNLKASGKTLLQAFGSKKWIKSNKVMNKNNVESRPINPFNNPTALQEYLNQWNPIESFERDAFRNFLYNRWILAVVEQRSLQVDYSQVNKDQISLNLEDCKRKQQIRLEFNSNQNSPRSTLTPRSMSNRSPRPLMYSNFRPIVKALSKDDLLQKYIEKKRDKYKNGDNQFSFKINQYDNQEWLMDKKKDQNDLIDFDIFYQRKVKILRAKQRLLYFLSRCYRLRISLKDIPEFIKAHSFSCYQKSGSFAMIQFLKSERFEECSKLLESNASLINDFNYLGETPLHICVRRNNLIMLQFVLSHNPDLESTNFSNQTPLQLAVILKHEEIVKFLLVCSANPWKSICRNRSIKIAAYCWTKIKCSSIYQLQDEDTDEFKKRVFDEMGWYLMSPRSHNQSEVKIYYNQSYQNTR